MLDLALDLFLDLGLNLVLEILFVNLTEVSSRPGTCCSLNRQQIGTYRALGAARVAFRPLSMLVGAAIVSS